ncbi:MAG: hypothetical protein JWO55_40 [Candidatus Saccharibacteria bacterium]|nr:hypothetical protein [Candidatus Saccharibacteria bacterium]
MSGFWFLVAVFLTILLLSGRKKSDADSYAKGYSDGKKAVSSVLESLIASGHTDVTSLHMLTRSIKNDTISTLTVGDDRSVADTYAEENDFYDGIASVEQPAIVNEMTVQETAEVKARRSLRNLNIILYTASFLLVAAAALFIASSSSAETKLVTVAAVIVLFYVVGFIVHTKSVRLQPAAIAFLGTSLAIIPFAGLAIEQYSSLSVTQSWLITSLVGLIAYFVVAIRLQSQLVAYLTMAFVLSLVGSMTAAGVSAIVWQFVVMIGVSLAASSIAYIKPGWMPKVFSKPIEHSGQIVTPVVLVASLFVFNVLHLVDYQIVFTVATVHYIVAWMQTRDIIYESIIRVLTYVVAGLIAWNIYDGDHAVIAFAIFLLLTLQYAYSLLMVKREGRHLVERIWIRSLFAVQTILFLFWLDYSLASLFTTVGLIVIGTTSFVVAWRLRTVPIAIIGLIASLILPIVVARELASPALEWWTVTTVFICAAVAGVYVHLRWRHRTLSLRRFVAVSYTAYLVLAVLTAWCDGTPLVLTATYFTVAAVTLFASYVSRMPRVQIFLPILAFLGLIELGDVLDIQQPWYMLFVGGIGALLFWSMSIVHEYLRQTFRQIVMLTSGQIILLVIAGAVLHGNEQASSVVSLILLLATFGSLALRWVYRDGLLAVRRVYSYSYPVFFAIVLMIAATLNIEWLATMLALGAVLFAVASYVERQTRIQVIANLFVIATLMVAAIIITLPVQWFALFVFGIAAVVFYAATGLHYAYRQIDRQFIMATSAQISLFLIIFGGMSGHYKATLTSFIILLIWAVVSLAIRWWCRDRSHDYSQLYYASYPVYYVGSLLLLSSLSTLWSVLAFTVGVIIFWVASYAERQPAMILIGNVLLVIALSVFWWWMDFSSVWMVLGVAWILAAVFYFGHWILKGLGDTWRSQALLWSTWVVLGLAIWLKYLYVSQTIAVSSTIIAFAATLAIEGRRVNRYAIIESAVYIATFGLQRIVEYVYPEVNIVAYAHWWAIIITIMAITRQAHKRTRWMIAIAFITVSSGLYALMNGGNYQLLFLIEHLALLVAGALLSKSWAIWWGLGASAIAVLYFLRGYTFLLLGFLGLLLIAIVVWRLMSTKTIKQ